MRLIGHDREAEAVEWVKSKIGIEHGVGYTQAFSAVDKDNGFALVVVLSNFSPGNIDIHIAGEPDKIRPRVFAQMFNQVFSYAFQKLGARRVTGLIASKNQQAMRFAELAGFTKEGVLRNALPDDSVCIYCLLAGEYLNHKWYEVPNVQ
jgi:RimJ/RimL family protein N-acetyltransferase